MLKLKFVYEDLTFNQEDNSVSCAREVANSPLMHDTSKDWKDSLNLPNKSMFVERSIFKAMLRNVPDFVKGVDPMWGRYGYCKTIYGKKIKMFEGFSLVVQEASQGAYNYIKQCLQAKKRGRKLSTEDFLLALKNQEEIVLTVINR